MFLKTLPDSLWFSSCHLLMELPWRANSKDSWLLEGSGRKAVAVLYCNCCWPFPAEQKHRVGGDGARWGWERRRWWLRRAGKKVMDSVRSSAHGPVVYFSDSFRAKLSATERLRTVSSVTQWQKWDLSWQLALQLVLLTIILAILKLSGLGNPLRSWTLSSTSRVLLMFAGLEIKTEE